MAYPISRALPNRHENARTCCPRKPTQSIGIFTAFAISATSSKIASLDSSFRGRRVSCAAYLAITARSSASPSNFSKIFIAGRSSFWSPRYNFETLFSEYDSRLRFLRNHWSRSSWMTPGVSR
ncbi:hypothetical protein ATCV1_z802R [Acanthocystis turfacea chlorella virus 1]|uniref:Uncharacterized protein z802R n=1 Tax=Chlorovirus heliozoae TaxID=322019 RepID=A7KA62_9PHYC|nr:hypothetical protein ATCV1_z802R [Acanthocystis turfacea chlorella virus 1]ABT16936.1 hypothetical protein ATCV1_z802R [Acanthocystis turfacea chlorella virus 1]